MYGYNNNYDINNVYAQRLQQLQQMQQPPQMQMQPQQQTLGNQITPIGSIEEVKAFNGYFDGQPHFFIDHANNIIYCKQLGMNGVPNIMAYKVAESVKEQNVEYCTKEEYKALKSDLDNYKSVLDNLLQTLGGSENE